MKDDRPIWLTSLAEADHEVLAPVGLENKLQSALRRRRWMTIARRAGSVGIAAALCFLLWLPSQKRTAIGEPVDDGMGLLTDVLNVAGDDDEGDFVPTLLASEQPLESVRFVRVSLPGGALARYGVSPADVSSTENVTADLMVGQDGIARAVRVVK